MSDDSRERHDLRNHLAVIANLAELLLAEADATDPRRGDFLEMYNAARAAVDLLAASGSGRPAGGGPDAHPSRGSTS